MTVRIVLACVAGMSWAVRAQHIDQVEVSVAGSPAIESASLDSNNENWKWHPVLSAGSIDLQSVDYGGGRWMVGAGQLGILTSPGGINWRRVSTLKNFSVKAVVHRPGQWLAAGSSWFEQLDELALADSLWSSPDGIVWTNLASVRLNQLAYGNQWVGVDGPDILKSRDGKDWQTADFSRANRLLNGVGYGDGRWVIAGDVHGSGGSSIYYFITSKNSSDWEEIFPKGVAGPPLPFVGVREWLGGVVFANGQWMAVGSYGTILRSINGSQWDLIKSHTTNHLAGVAFGDRFWVAVGENGTILRSADGLDWNRISSGTSLPLTKVAFGNGRWVALADQGTIFMSDPNQPVINPKTTPLAQIASPAGEAHFALPLRAPLPVQVNAESTNGAVAEIELFLDDRPVADETGPPFSLRLEGKPWLGPGSYSLTAVATDSDGFFGVSPSILIHLEEASPIGFPSSIGATNGTFGFTQFREFPNLGDLQFYFTGGHLPIMVEASKDLQSWETIMALPSLDENRRFTVTNANRLPYQFFRLRSD